MEEYEVTHRPERNRFELEKNGMTAFVEYEVEDGTLDIMPSFLPLWKERGLRQLWEKQPTNMLPDKV